MKTYNYLLLVCTFLCHIVSAQSHKNNKADPAAQLKQLLLLPSVGPPSIKVPAKIQMPKKPGIPAFNIAKNMTEAKMKCPLLKFIPTLSLEGERSSNEKVGLTWETSNGFNNWAFDVERSLGDTLNFDKVNFVWADTRFGIKDKYRLPDDNDYSEISYYRLKLVLDDGKFVYSNIAEVKGYDKFTFAVYPNPASRKLKIDLTTKSEGNASISLYDASGKMVFQQSSFLTMGFDLKEIDVTRLSSGLYTIKIILPDKQIRIGKFVKN